MALFSCGPLVNNEFQPRAHPSSLPNHRPKLHHHHHHHKLLRRRFTQRFCLLLEMNGEEGRKLLLHYHTAAARRRQRWWRDSIKWRKIGASGLDIGICTARNNSFIERGICWIVKSNLVVEECW
ncbi:PREDICTED: uncharacterized protein LOC105957418 isoform X2 [Erythranthe guttata]|uniref:uncharacterized protein LOC105957418 isoform X2 n=1 Tax=Erythranthe guttata TaxID=4155 RepID=UPI00064DC123|nr:PREDICTED: uncharacterized protein LOC105957418 isoform X2 [Erythranthe guttata]|eukprot:XP_012836795.1 PREDICTED: uncharacterized protein LOC105957418 isoform X2 [Erythranthe guttata]